jgi:transposase InsO family protein
LLLPPTDWPETKLEVCGAAKLDADKEIRKNFVSKRENTLLTFIETRFSDAAKIVRHFVLIRRMIPRSPHRSKPVTMDETEEALENVIRILQRAYFSEECKFFDRQHDDPSLKFPSRSPLLQLKPFVNSRGTICVGGRLRASSGLTERQKHPFILPSCHFSKLLICDLHHEHCHPGNASMLSFIREKFWILGAKSTIRRVKHECHECFRVKPPLPEQIMGDLPPARLEMRPVFISTAVDYAGPFNMRMSLARNSSVTKVYIAVYRCMVTGLVHLEPVTSLTTEAFIACFDRFVSRRGLPRDLYSDNGTNFVGADREFVRILKEIEPEIQRHMSQKNIIWHFTTPGASHAGGVYEAIVKLMKHHLVRLCAYRSFVFEQLVTILCKAEAVVNSRPLTPLSDDVDDFRVLTPAHFLLGRSLIAKPERNFIPLPTNRLNTYNEIQQIEQKFWDCWYHDYLHHLQTRPKRFRTLNEFHVGDFVLLKDSNLPPLKWQMGRIVQLFPDKNNEIRNVLVKMSKKDGEPEHKYKHRHVKYLAFLPKEDSEHPAAPGVCSPTETD